MSICTEHSESQSKCRTKKNRRRSHSKQSELGLQILFGNEWHKWTYLQDQLSYVTPNYISRKVAQLGKHYFSDAQVCWDMFGGMGMDAINLANVFNKVIVTEVDPTICEIQANNLETLNTKSNVAAFCRDCVAASKDPEFMEGIDVIHFDPPWGETFRTYEEFYFENVHLPGPGLPEESESSGPGINIISLLNYLYQNIPRMILKSPIKCNSFERWAADQVPPVNILQTCEFPTHKLKYLYIDKPTVQKYHDRIRSNSHTGSYSRPRRHSGL